MAPILADSIWVDGWPMENNAPPTTYKGGNNSSMARFCGDRHQGRVLVVFNDSRVEEVELPNLWTLHWHKEWKTPATLPSPHRVRPLIFMKKNIGIQNTGLTVSIALLSLIAACSGRSGIHPNR